MILSKFPCPDCSGEGIAPRGGLCPVCHGEGRRRLTQAELAVREDLHARCRCGMVRGRCDGSCTSVYDE